MSIRLDSSRYLTYLIRKNDQNTPFESLKKILSEEYILGASDCIKGSYDVICFSESTIVDLARHIYLYKNFIRKNEKKKSLYSFYGLSFCKDLMYDFGARPVISQPAADFIKLPDELRYLHKSYDPLNNVDFNWEREWRMRTERFLITQIMPIVLVEKNDDVMAIQQEFYTMQSSHYSNLTLYGVPFAVNIEIFPYMIVSLEMLV